MANVLNKTTMELLYSVNTPDYSPSEWVINPDPTLLATVPLKYLKVVGEGIVEMTQDEKNVVDTINLDDVRTKYLTLVNNAGEAYIVKGPGVEFPVGSGKFLSVSTNAQLKWMGWVSVADIWTLMGMSYPFRVRTIDDSDYVEIHNSDEVREVFALMAGFITTVLAGSETAKAAITEATTEEEVIAAANAYLATVPLSQ